MQTFTRPAAPARRSRPASTARPRRAALIPALLALLAAAPAATAGAASSEFAAAEAAWWEGMQRTEFGAWGLECLHCKRLALRQARLDEADPTLKYDPATGEDRRNYAPSRRADYKHMRLFIDIPDMDVPTFSATQSLTFEPIGLPLATLELDAMQLDIQTVSLDAPTTSTVSHTYDGEHLTLSFDPPIAPGATNTLLIEYDVHQPADGLFWIPSQPDDADAWPGRPAQIHTQGQPETNRYWFPAHDFPNERLTTELIVRVPEPYTVLSNGTLVGGQPRQQIVNGEPFNVYRWLQDDDHVTYLVTLVVGQFDIVDVAPPGSDIPMPVYAPPGQGENARKTLANTEAIIRTLERRFDEPYPYNKYANAIVWNFGAGGMENTTATTLYDTAALDDIARQDADLDGLNSHEIAHQWFGDLITCKTWEHIWLNEGWATYATSLWLEDRDGYNEGYLRNLYGQVRGLARRDQLQPGSTHIRPGMASPVYGHPWEVFRRTSNPYPKGAAVLHMLRMKLGEDLFFDAIAEYLDRYKNTSVETDDFRTTLEDVSGLSLEHFFDQWVIRPGTPNVQIDAHWDDAAGELRLTVAQQQRIDQLHPAFVFDLPIHIYTDPSTEPTVVTIPVSRRTHERAVSLPAEPAMVVIDPHLSVLMALTTDMPTDWLHAQARRAPTLSARMEAAEFLADHASPKTARTLRDILTNTAEHWSVRQQAARSLGELGEADALTAILGSGDIENPKVRRAVVEGLAAAVTPSSNDADRAIDLLAMHAGSAERSYACRTAALEAIGRLGSMQRHRAVIEDALAFDSQHDQVRRGALRALANFNHPDGIELAAPFTRFGHLSRLRPVAIDAVAELAHHDRDRAFAIIQPIVLSSGDGETRALRAAIEALVVVKHSAGIDTLERFASRTKHPVRKQDALDARDRLAAALRSDDRGAPTAEALERLQRQINDLRDELAQQKGPATPN